MARIKMSLTVFVVLASLLATTPSFAVGSVCGVPAVMGVTDDGTDKSAFIFVYDASTYTLIGNVRIKPVTSGFGATAYQTVLAAHNHTPPLFMALFTAELSSQCEASCPPISECGTAFAVVSFD